MIRFHYKHAGSAPAQLLPPEGSSPRAAISLVQYDAETILEENFNTVEELFSKLDPAKVNWIDIDGLGNVDLLNKLGEHFHIHPLALEDVLNTTQRPKVERFHEH